MARSRADRLPAPPADVGKRNLPVTELKGPIFRIFHSRQRWDFFGVGRNERFNDPDQKYGVLYAAVQPDAAFAEVFLRDLSLRFVAEADLQDRSLVTIATRPLKCVNLLGPGLNKLSCDNRVSTEKPYETTGRWSRALFEHPSKPDGIIYRSRHNPEFHCLALFERCRRKLRVKASVIEQLMGGHRRAWTANQLHKYQLPIASV